MAGGAAPRLAAFFAIHSRATRTLSSVPALSWKTETQEPPLAVRTRQKLTKPWTARISLSTSALFLLRPPEVLTEAELADAEAELKALQRHAFEVVDPKSR